MIVNNARQLSIPEGQVKKIESNGDLLWWGHELKTTTGNPIVINDCAETEVTSFMVEVNPIQDLHGYDKPWGEGSGKNKFLSHAQSETIDGVTFTPNADGTVTVNGTATNNVIYTVSKQEAPQGTPYYCRLNEMGIEADKQYILNGTPSGGSANTFRTQLLVYGSGQEPYDTGSGTSAFSFSASDIEDKYYRLAIRVSNGVTLNNAVFKPMIRLATETDATYAPYSNICPISGWKGLQVKRMGKNLINDTGNIWTLNAYINAEGAVSSNNNYKYVTNLIPVKPNTAYYVQEYKTQDTASGITVPFYDAGGNFIQRIIPCVATTGTGVKGGSFTTTADTHYIRISLEKNAYNIMLELGSTRSNYEAYTGQNFDVIFPALGKNLFNQSIFGTEVNKIVYTTMPIANGTYTMSTNFPRDNNTANVFVFAGTATSGASSSNNGVTATTPRTITVTDGYYTIAYRSSDSNNTNNPKDFNWQLESGSSATSYEPFNNNVYGGTLDITTGELTVTWSGVIMDGTVNKANNCRQVSDTSEFTYLRGLYIVDFVDLLNTIPYNTGESICSHFPWYTYSARRAARPDSIYYASSARLVYWCSSTYTTLEEFNDFLKDEYNNGTPVILVYPRGTSPITYQLDPQQINLLIPNNTITTNANRDLTVSYYGLA